ncbi:hypothetical protein ACG3SL_05365 [Sphingomonas sp. CJ20]
MAGARKGWLIATLVVLALLLPLFGASLIALLIVDTVLRGLAGRFKTSGTKGGLS